MGSCSSNQVVQMLHFIQRTNALGIEIEMRTFEHSCKISGFWRDGVKRHQHQRFVAKRDFENSGESIFNDLTVIARNITKRDQS